MGNWRYQRTAHRMTSAGKRQPRNARASVMDGALGGGGGGSAAPTRSQAAAQRNRSASSLVPDNRILSTLLFLNRYETVVRSRQPPLLPERSKRLTSSPRLRGI